MKSRSKLFMAWTVSVAIMLVGVMSGIWTLVSLGALGMVFTGAAGFLGFGGSE